MPKPITMSAVVMSALVAAGAASADDSTRLLAEAKITLLQAIERAAREAPEGVVVEAELEKEGGRVVYSLDIAQKGAVLELHLDAHDGSVVSREYESKDLTKLAQAKVSLAQAVSAALSAHPGQAVAASYHEKSGRLSVDVKLVSDGKDREVMVDAATGQAAGGTR